MREKKFIEQNREKWAEFEELLRQNKKDPDKLNDLFVQITDDLSHARTFYPNRSVRVYLNGLAQQVFHLVYKGKRFPFERLWNFWLDEMPQVMWEARRALLLSFSIFAFAVGIGIVSSIIEPDFARVILGDGYVDMTIQNIEKGDPMAVYKEKEALGMSLGIALNNIWVALLTALLGVLASIGTVFLLLSNGVMLGSFQWFFVERDLFWESFLTIWIHGTLEIGAIVIAGAAGLTAGSGLLFPGTHTRVQAFQLSIRRGLKIFIGLVPVFALAAFFEGFLTRFTETPDIVRGLFILTSLLFLIWYFIWLPRKQAKIGFAKPLREKELPPSRVLDLDFSEIKTSGEIFSDCISIVRGNAVWFFGSNVLAAAVFAFLAFIFSPETIEQTFVFPQNIFGVASGAGDFFGKSGMDWLLPLQIGLLSVLSMLAFSAIRKAIPDSQRPEFSWRNGLWATLMLLLPDLILIFAFKTDGQFFTYCLLILACPFAGLWAFVLQFETANPFQSLARTWNLMRWSEGFWVGFIVASLGLLLFLFLDSPIFSIVSEFLGWNILSGNAQRFMTVLLTFLAAAALYLTYWMVLLAGGLMYFSFREIEDAVWLRENIEGVGVQRQIRGLARE